MECAGACVSGLIDTACIYTRQLEVTGNNGNTLIQVYQPRAAQTNFPYLFCAGRRLAGRKCLLLLARPVPETAD